MHQYKTIAQILLVLSILNLVFAAPMPRVVYNTDNDAVVAAEGMTTVSDRRRGIPLAPGGTTPLQDSSPSSPEDGSPPHNSESLPLEGSAPLQDSAPSGGSSPSSHSSATDGQVPVYDSTTEAPTSAHPLSAAGGPPPVSETTEASTSPHHSLATDGPVPVLEPTAEGSTTEDHTAATHDIQNNEGLRSSSLSKPLLKKVATVGGQLAIIAAGITGVVEFVKWWVKPERKRIQRRDDLPSARAAGCSADGYYL